MGPRVMHNLFRGGNITSGTSALHSIEGRSKGGDDVGNGIGKSGGIPDGGVSDGSIPDRGSRWKVDGDSALNWIIAALYPKG
ncbi:hypothetical protein Tco_0305875 [Tanacetum coccineum]